MAVITWTACDLSNKQSPVVSIPAFHTADSEEGPFPVTYKPANIQQPPSGIEGLESCRRWCPVDMATYGRKGHRKV